MKKFLSLTLTLLITFTLSACSIIPDLPGPIGIPGI
ncbi:MAG: hypothetical protein ISEC1_P0270 [Thiomicrorhabdus sp.]|nr:MAG: hypothetical protein ISEC1_P0270 [Thiomicrorhabdus sp.]